MLHSSEDVLFIFRLVDHVERHINHHPARLDADEHNISSETHVILRSSSSRGSPPFRAGIIISRFTASQISPSEQPS